MQTINQEHADLENKLSKLWETTVISSCDGGLNTFDWESLRPLFEPIGIIKGMPRQPWFHRLGQLRGMVQRVQWDNDASQIHPTQLAITSWVDNWLVAWTDGSCKDGPLSRKGKHTKTSGSGVIFPLDPDRPIAFRTTGYKQDSDIGEVEAALAARHRAGNTNAVLLMTDSQRVRNLINADFEKWKTVPPTRKAAKQISVVMLALLQCLAAGGTHAVKVPAHTQLVLNETADHLAKFGTTMARGALDKDGAYPKVLGNINLQEAIMLIRTWGVNSSSDDKPRAIPNANPRFRTKFENKDLRYRPKISFAKGKQPAREEEVRRYMEPVITDLCHQLKSLCKTAKGTEMPHVECPDVTNMREAFSKITTHFDRELWQITVATFGTFRCEFDPSSPFAGSKQHTDGYNINVAQLNELIFAVQAAEATQYAVDDLDSFEHVSIDGEGNLATRRAQRSPGNANELLELEAEFQRHTATVCKIMGLGQPNSATEALKNLQRAKLWAVERFDELKKSAKQDTKQKRQATPRGLWRFKSIKQYFRHLQSRNISKPIQFQVEPMTYLKFLTDKELPETFPKPTGEWMAPYPQIPEQWIEMLNAPVTPEEALHLLMAAREASAPSPLSQVSYKMMQMTLPQVYKDQISSNRRKERANRSDAWAMADIFEVEQFTYTRYGTALDAATFNNCYAEASLAGHGSDILTANSGNKAQEYKMTDFGEGLDNGAMDEDAQELLWDSLKDQPLQTEEAARTEELGIHHYISLVAEAVVLLRWKPVDLDHFCVRPQTKYKPEEVAMMSDTQIQAAGKECKKMREVMLGHCLRKLLGGVPTKRVLRMVKELELNCDVQLGYIPGIDPSRLNHCKVNIARFWTTLDQSASEIIILYDWQSFFSFIKSHNALRAQEFLQFNETVTGTLLQTLGQPKQIFYTAKGKKHGPANMNNDVQGCSESVCNAVTVSLEFCKAADNMEAGFSLPNLNQGAPKLNACMQVDDLKVIVGGQGKSWQQVRKEAIEVNNLVLKFQQEMGFMASAETDPTRSKTVAIARLRGVHGMPIESDLGLSTLTQQGMVEIPKLMPGQAHADLGLQLHAEYHGTTAATFDKDMEKIMTRAKTQIDPDLPVHAQMYCLWISVLGGTRWLSDKAQCIPYDLAIGITKATVTIVKKILRLTKSSSTNLLFLPKVKFGIGFPHFTHAIMKSNLMNVIADKSSASNDMKRWSWCELDFAREVNVIAGSSKMHGAGFFDWDISKLNIKEVASLPFQCAHTWALMACLHWNLRTVEIVTTNGSRIALANTKSLINVIKHPQLRTDGRNAVYTKSAISSLLKKAESIYFDVLTTGLVATELHSERKMFDARLSNAWRSDPQVRDSAYKFAIKACSGQIVTPAIRCYRFKVIESARCPMRGCSSTYCDLNHILQHCIFGKAKRTYRHNEMGAVVIKQIKDKCSHWSYVGEQDCAPPDFLIPHDWKSQIKQIVPKAEQQPIKPDLIIADAISPSNLRVRIIDFQVPWDTRIVVSEQIKREKYEPLAKVIRKFWKISTGFDAEVIVVPIVAGARGTISAEWMQCMGLLEITDRAKSAAKQISRGVIERSAEIYYDWVIHESSIPGRR